MAAASSCKRSISSARCPIGDVRHRVQEIHAIMAEHDDWGHKRVANSLADKLNVTIEDTDRQAVLVIMKKKKLEQEGQARLNMRDYTDTIKKFMSENPDAGKSSIGSLLAQRFDIKLAPADYAVIERIMRELRDGRVAKHTLIQDSPSKPLYEACKDITPHKQTIAELWAENPGHGYKAIGKALEHKCKVRLSDACYGAIRRMLAKPKEHPIL
ncbi:unnamed protein product [Prorocentrum cordatum]|uniref:Uncharacterized protein n=1 Tax=Prorocentrum cordatum TaxID=2364126 RepID=A0ABN9XBF5_9DINO|nr:unnamed protein product [Polarella glacialis]